jgi:hypothetical protein
MLSKLLLILFAGSVAWAQSNQASMSGVVADEQGAVIPAAKVSAVNAATQLHTDTVTNGSGFYSLPNLPIGTYTLTVENPGFRRTVRDGMTLTTGQAMELNVRMELGQVSETVKVTGEARCCKREAPMLRN